MARILALAALLILCGCQTGTTERFEQSLKPFIGAPEGALVGAFGAPDASYSVGKDKYLSYRHQMVGSTMGVEPSYTSTVIGNTIYTRPSGGIAPSVYTMWCTIDWYIVGGIVRSYRYAGNSCLQ
ncbi:hypothetical protein EN784_01760 [bacterium M00.F.Ca.ET.141.01.1.1]|nr:hypothetical protein EOA35_18525 [Mesorhizobium sp. M8A.F.Ca.ET.023.01.1.1]RWC77796.1 MAG: hypothetical protein EOS71_00710 [Mesorhizobium sp.]TGV61147.1 hypothetical protein EN784_01760 [bacterium M00.F.Ca.ET.141.01.1.1]TIT00145.1 MAG: hypothetical protein E5W88_01710 [Mesorhizobium sp.]TIW88681.1 MAG: hypothetical protein E5V51_07450 [Mesorhizobium sp.]